MHTFILVDRCGETRRIEVSDDHPALTVDLLRHAGKIWIYQYKPVASISVFVEAGATLVDL